MRRPRPGCGRPVIAGLPAPPGRRSRAMSQSVSRASGIVTTMKTSATATYGVKLNVPTA